MMNTTDRFIQWLQAAKERAALMEQLAPTTTEATPRRRPAAAPEAGSVETWHEPERLGNVVIQDPPNFIAHWQAKQAAQAKPDARLFRVIHGKSKTTKAA